MIERTTLEHVESLAKSMREATVLGLLASCGLGPLAGLERSIAVSSWTRTILLGGKVGAIFGVRTLGPRWARLWMMTGRAVDAHKLSFFRDCRAEIERLRTAYDVIECEIDARDVRLVGMVERLGFQVQPSRPFGIAGLFFHHIELRSGAHV